MNLQTLQICANYLYHTYKVLFPFFPLDFWLVANNIRLSGKMTIMEV
jgi:hypothetical protein